MSDKDTRDVAHNVGGSAAQPADRKMSAEKGGGQPFVLFEDKIEIYYGQNIARLDVAENKAYRAIAVDKARTPLVAVICEPHLIPRISSISAYGSISNPFLLQLVRYGKIYWPPAKQERFVLFYFDNPGQAIFKEGERAALGWRQEEVVQAIVKPMLEVFMDFRDKDFVHGAIRPSNMFNMAPPDAPKKIMLGECLSAPSFYTQPPLYLSVERAHADPVARGRGTQADDLYAFGVSLAVILRQYDPLFEMKSAEVIRNKISAGSYITVTGKERFKGETLELLRGLLHDDPVQRWKIDEIQAWLDGRRLTPKQSIVVKKARRAISFANDKILLTPLLAMELGRNLSETRTIVEDDSLFQWLDRAIGEEELSLRFDKALMSAKLPGVGPGYEERLAANLSIALDPNAPIRYKNIHTTGDGIGTALAKNVVLKQPLAPFAEMIGSGIATNWLAMQDNPSVDTVGLHSRFEACRRFLRSNKIGEGLERVLYVLCPDSYCLSDIVKDYYVMRTGDLLLAFEDLCRKNKVPSMFLDRHSVGFLMQRDSKVIEPYVFDLNTKDRRKAILVNLKCLAAIQKRHDTGGVPFVTKALFSMISSVFERYHDRTLREKLKKSAAEYAEKGDLQKMSALLENPETISRDFTDFRRAMLEFAVIEKERYALEAGLAGKDKFGLESGREWSAIVSCAIAAIAIMVIATMFLSDKPLF
ncbi:MAG: hypothetical protein IT559_00475 [Alphaproteobacteria bacterium]|nr:hypothetical protein [Alphaproteobacteria bacterium]